jgi:hypothetical protein
VKRASVNKLESFVREKLKIKKPFLAIVYDDVISLQCFHEVSYVNFTVIGRDVEAAENRSRTTSLQLDPSKVKRD